jgi:hypothetical protein
MIEFAVEMEAGPAGAPVAVRHSRILYERDSLQFWQGVAALLSLALWRRPKSHSFDIFTDLASNSGSVL